MTTPIVLFVRMRPKPEHREAAQAALERVEIELNRGIPKLCEV